MYYKLLIFLILLLILLLLFINDNNNKTIELYESSSDLSIYKKNYYTPTNIEEYNIWDIVYSPNGEIVIIIPSLSRFETIKIYNNNEIIDITSSFKNDMNYKGCVYNYLTNTYIPEISLIINDKEVKGRVNKYPELKNKIIMSTLVKNEDKYIIQWIKYHMFLGIEAFIIYDNSTDNYSLGKLLEEYIHKNIVILIEWRYPYFIGGISDMYAQPTQLNHSLYAFKNSKYIGFMDIDEYLNPQKNYTNINTLFDDVIKENNVNINDISGFRLLCKMFYNIDKKPDNDYEFLKMYNCDNVLSQTYEKNFIIPQNITIFNHIHIVHNTYTIHTDILYFNHYIFLGKNDENKNSLEDKKDRGYGDNKNLKNSGYGNDDKNLKDESIKRIVDIFLESK